MKECPKCKTMTTLAKCPRCQTALKKADNSKPVAIVRNPRWIWIPAEPDGIDRLNGKSLNIR